MSDVQTLAPAKPKQQWRRSSITPELLDRFAAAALKQWQCSMDPGFGGRLTIEVPKRRVTFSVSCGAWGLFHRMAFAGFVLGFLGRGYEVASGTEPAPDAPMGHRHFVRAIKGDDQYEGTGDSLGEACFFVGLAVLEARAKAAEQQEAPA